MAAACPLLLFFVFFAFFVLACSEESEAPPESAYAVGERIYANVCVACHHADPTQNGSLGPAVAGSSRELVIGKVLHGEYPPGYQPKRPGGNMPKYTYLEERIEELAVYLEKVGS